MNNNLQLTGVSSSMINDQFHRTMGFLDNEEGETENNRIQSVKSSNSNLSESSNVRVTSGRREVSIINLVSRFIKSI